MNITIPDDKWQAVGSDKDRSARLLTGITINGLDLHLEAWAVEPRSEAQFRDAVAVDPSVREGLTLFQNEMDCAFRSVEINRREYVLIATPYGR